MRLVPVILSGGSGSRLWPVSREYEPKPFIRLKDGRSLIQQAFLLGAALPGVDRILTVTNRELVFKTRDEYRALGADIETPFILEPFGRNTAPAAIGAALHLAETMGPDTLLLILPADQLIADGKAFQQAVAEAVRLAEQGELVTFGIRPDRPETGYGYIRADGTHALEFVEKPDLETAERYVAAGDYLWNAGVFVFSAATLLEEAKAHCPDVLAAMRAVFGRADDPPPFHPGQMELPADGFDRVPAISIDYAVMEKSRQVAVVPCDIGWSDVGSWKSFSRLLPPDRVGNRVEAETLLRDVTNCYIRGEGRLIAGIGLDNLIIVDTPDALLVGDQSRSEDVKHLVGELKAQGHATHRLHRTVHRPWGSYTVLGEGPFFKIKLVEVKAGERLSLQLHHHRSEHWIVVSGTAKVVNGDRDMLVHSNESTFIPAGRRHCLENPGLIDLVIIEVQSGAYLGEDDIVRFHDVYGRPFAETEP